MYDSNTEDAGTRQSVLKSTRSQIVDLNTEGRNVGAGLTIIMIDTQSSHHMPGTAKSFT